MHIESGQRHIRVAGLVVSILLLVVSANLSLKAVAAALPAHSHASIYGSGWECSRGYRRVDEACVAIEVPANAYLNSSGGDWTCERGYRQVDKACLMLKVPPAAHADEDQFGRGWECDRGYREAHGSCLRVAVPP